MIKKNVIVALDIGSSNIKILLARYKDNNISIIGTYSVPGEGIKDGIINDIDNAVESIVQVVNRGEMMSGYPISRLVVLTSGSHISSLNSNGVVAVSSEDNEIRQSDINRVKQAAEVISLGANRQILHAISREFIVDNQRNIKNPIGMTGFRLEVEANITHGSSTILKNITKCISQVGLRVDRILYAGYASAEAVLTETEKNLGCVCIDIGGGTIDIIIYQSGSPSYSAVIPVGGQSLTNQLAISLRTTVDKAEEVKVKFNQDYIGTDKETLKASERKFDTNDLEIELDEISPILIQTVLEKKLIESFKYIQVYLKKSGYEKKVPAGIVITGGTAGTNNIKDIAESILGLPVRVGRANNLTGLIDQINGPESSALVGAIKIVSEEEFGSLPKVNESSKEKNKIKKQKNNSSIFDFIKSFLPI